MVAVATTLGTTSALAARDSISIVGSSTVYPFATVVAEQFGKTTDFKTPKIESTGSGGGIKLFCAGIGVQTPDITNSSRRIKSSEVASCAANGVKDIVEVKFGYDGIVLASSRQGPDMDITVADAWLALAKDVPDPAGGDSFVANPYRKWSEINPDLPDAKIEILGPPPTSGTRDAFVELVMDEGCEHFEQVKALEETDPEVHKARCQGIREDGAFIEAGENDNLIVQKLEASPSAYGIFGFSFLDQNIDKVKGAAIDGVEPEFESIADGSYPVSRPLYFYVKKAHVGSIPGIAEYLNEFTSEQAWGPDGYLADRGLIPMPDEEREQVRQAVTELQNLNLAAK
jgi:phosphate transport system substrate-binding protein